MKVWLGPASKMGSVRAATVRERMAINRAEGIRSLALAALRAVVAGQFSCVTGCAPGP